MPEPSPHSETTAEPTTTPPPPTEVERVELQGDLDIATVPMVRDVVVEGTRAAVVEVDMAGVRFVDSSGLAALLDARAALDAQGRSLRLTRATDQFLGLLDVTGLAAELPVAD